MGNPRLQLTSLFLALLGAAFLPGHEAFRSMKFTTFDSPTTPSPPPSPSLPPPSPHSPPPPTHHDPPPGSPPPASASPPPPASPPAPASPSPPPLARHDSPPSVVHRKSPPPPESSPPPPPAPDAEITPTPVVHREPPPPPPTKQSHPPPPAALSPPPPIHSANVPHHAASERKLLEDGSYSFHVGSEPESSSNSHHDQSQLPTNDETSPTANHAAVDTIFDNELPHQVSDSPLEGDHHPMSHLQSEKKLSGEEQFPVPNSGSTRKCGISDPPAPTPAIAPVSGGPVSVPSPYGGYAPVGSPFYQPGDPGSPSPAPAPTAGSDEGRQPYYNSPSPPSSNSTVAHTTTYNQCTYTIITSTGNIEGAGTTADVNAEFFDKYGNSVLFVNLKSQNKNFERGTTDTFTIVGDCVHNICRMHLSHDDSGSDPSWFVDTVTVSLMYQTHVFNVFEWLAKTEPPYSLTKTVSSCPNA